MERAIDVLARKTEHGSGGTQAEELHPAGAIPLPPRPWGGNTTAATTKTAMRKAMETVGTMPGCGPNRRKGVPPSNVARTRELMGIGVSFLHRDRRRGAPTRNCDILGIGMFDSCEIRIHPTGAAIARMGTISQGQGHQTTYAQILATELGIPADMIDIEEGDTDTAPYGLGTYGSRSTPVAGAATAMAARKIKAKAQMIAAHMLEVHEGRPGMGTSTAFRVKGLPEKDCLHEGDLLGGLQQRAAQHGAGTGGGELLWTRPT